MAPKTSAVAPITVTAVLILPLIYFGCFYALREPRPYAVSAGTIYPTYRVGGEVSETIFAPAYRVHLLVDRLLSYALPNPDLVPPHP